MKSKYEIYQRDDLINKRSILNRIEGTDLIAVVALIIALIALFRR